MCGIVGYVGRTDDGTALDVVMEGLARLEYRGYDSAGVALIDGDHVETRKKSGKLANLTAELEADPMPSSTTGIGHTRWATHGGPTDQNAHPHRGGKDGKLALIHNGIIENFHSLKKGLLADGVEFTSETDTEVVAHLVAAAYEREQDLTDAMRAVVAELEGAFTLLAIHADQPGVVVGARRNSPLVVGLGDDANYLGSDVAAFIASVRSPVSAYARATRCAATSVSVSLSKVTPSASRPFLREWKFSMMPLWMRASLPSAPPRCGWAFWSVGPPCVAHRVWPMPVVAPGSASASRAPRRFTSLPARFSVATPPSVTSATPAES